MANKDKVVWCDRGWFPANFGFCPNKKAWNRIMKRIKIRDSEYPVNDAQCSTFFNVKDGKTIILVTVGDHIDCKDHLGIIGMLVHEATHVWQNICEDAQDDSPSHEAQAYAMQNITMSLINAYSDTRGVDVSK